MKKYGRWTWFEWCAPLGGNFPDASSGPCGVINYKALLNQLKDAGDLYEALSNWALDGEPSIMVKGLRGKDTKKKVAPSIIEALKKARWLSADASRPRDDVYAAFSLEIPQIGPQNTID